MEEAGYNITNKEFKKISKWAGNIYNIAVIVDYCLVVGIKRARSRFSPLPTIRFVGNQPEIEECYNLAPVIKNLRDNADLLNAFFIDNFQPQLVRAEPTKKACSCKDTL